MKALDLVHAVEAALSPVLCGAGMIVYYIGGLWTTLLCVGVMISSFGGTIALVIFMFLSLFMRFLIIKIL